MALIRYPATFEHDLTATPADLRALVSDNRTVDAAAGGFLRYFVQARGAGVEWADATAAPAAAGPWHTLPDGFGVILAVPEAGAQRPWLRATGTGAKVVISGANATEG